MDYLETAYGKLDEIRTYLYQPIGSAATNLSPLPPYHNVGHLHQKDRHAPACNVKILGFSQPCSCCRGSMTFSNAQRFVDSLFQPSGEKPVAQISSIRQSTGIGLQNVGKMFGYSNAKSSLDAVFGTGADRHENILFGTNGVISRTLTHWESVIRDLFDLVDKLRAELFKMREEMERARDEWKRQREEMEGGNRAAEQKAQAGVAAAEQKASGLQDRLTAAQAALRTAEASRKFAKALRAQRSTDIGPMGRLQRRRVPANRVGLTRERTFRVRNKASTDGGGLNRSTNSRRRATTQSTLDELIETGGPIHLPDEQCPPETDVIAYNDYRAKVCARGGRARAAPRALGLVSCAQENWCVCVCVCCLLYTSPSPRD